VFLSVTKQFTSSVSTSDALTLDDVTVRVSIGVTQYCESNTIDVLRATGLAPKASTVSLVRDQLSASANDVVISKV